MYDFWIIIVPRVLGALICVAMGIWGTRAIVAVFTRAERLRLHRTLGEYQGYHKRSQDLLKVISMMASHQLPDDLIVEIAYLISWKPGTNVSEKTRY